VLLDLLYVCFVDRCLSFCPFLLAIVLSVLLRYTDSDYPFDIFKLFFATTLVHRGVDPRYGQLDLEKIALVFLREAVLLSTSKILLAESRCNVSNWKECCASNKD
jgi:hypothetical protein